MEIKFECKSEMGYLRAIRLHVVKLKSRWVVESEAVRLEGPDAGIVTRAHEAKGFKTKAEALARLPDSWFAKRYRAQGCFK